MQRVDSKPENAGSTVDWYDAVGFCRWLGQQMGLAESDQPYSDPARLDKEQYPREPNPVRTGPRNWPLGLGRGGFRLPMEAEWEVAIRAGARTAYSYGGDVSLLGRFDWFGDLSAGVHPPRQLRPGRRGLFDVHGNLWERTHDWFRDYDTKPPANSLEPDGSSGRVDRGARIPSARIPAGRRSATGTNRRTARATLASAWRESVWRSAGSGEEQVSGAGWRRVSRTTKKGDIGQIDNCKAVVSRLGVCPVFRCLFSLPFKANGGRIDPVPVRGRNIAHRNLRKPIERRETRCAPALICLTYPSNHRRRTTSTGHESAQRQPAPTDYIDSPQGDPTSAVRICSDCSHEDNDQQAWTRKVAKRHWPLAGESPEILSRLRAGTVAAADILVQLRSSQMRSLPSGLTACCWPSGGGGSVQGVTSCPLIASQERILPFSVLATMRLPSALNPTLRNSSISVELTVP